MPGITFLVHRLLCLSKKTIVLTETVTWVLNMFHFYLLRLSCHFFMLMTIQEELHVS
jgi:hypothetical protein